MENTAQKQAIGIFNTSSQVLLFSKQDKLYADISSNGTFFQPTGNTPYLFRSKKTFFFNRKENIPLVDLSDLRISKLKNQYTMVFWAENKLQLAVSSNLWTWQVSAELLPQITKNAMLIPNYLYGNQYTLIFPENGHLRLAFSTDLITWFIHEGYIPLKCDENKNITVVSVFHEHNEISVIYAVEAKIENRVEYNLKILQLDEKNPEKITWQLDEPFWHQPSQWSGKKISPVGAVYFNDNVISYWDLGDGSISAITHSFFQSLFNKTSELILNLSKHRKNPILAPHTDHIWENQAVFNPAAVLDNGKVHLIYRAIGDQYISVMGYATSDDGISINYRSDVPIYVPREPFEGGTSMPTVDSIYRSGPGYGGCEDPRLTLMDDKLYMMYVAFNGWGPPRVALSSIPLSDFRSQHWVWEKPVLISKPDEVNKNACLLPEKINGKYVIFHRVFPNILIDYVDDLNFDGKTKWIKEVHRIEPSKEGWDSRKVGVGPTPLKTEAGWLLIYHAVDDKDAGQYKMGAMLLDLKDPARVIARTKRPILAPTMWYENHGHKAGVAYPCGALIQNDTLYVYYGGADTVICVATAHLPTFLDQLLHNHLISMEVS